MVYNRVVLADSDPAARKGVSAILTEYGYIVVGECEDGHTALKLVRSRAPDLVILDASLPGMDGLEVAKIIIEDRLAPVVVYSAKASDPALIEKAKQARVAALLPKPLDAGVLIPALELASAHFAELARLENQVRELKETLETRKLIERAKGILMEALHISEAEAYRRMQRSSMNKRIPLRQVAEAIILSYSLTGDKGDRPQRGGS